LQKTPFFIVISAELSFGIRSSNGGTDMKKRKSLQRTWIAAVLSAALLAGCTASTAKETATVVPVLEQDLISYQDDQLYAIAYIGQDEHALPYYLNTYTRSSEEGLQICTVSQGDYYLIIPRYSTMTVKVDKIDVSTSKETAVFEQSDCKPFLLRCNVSEIFLDAAVTITYEKETETFSPSISLKDGSVLAGERGLVLPKETGKSLK
jgi:hypothetical protein